MKTNSIAELLKAKGIQVDPQPPSSTSEKAMRLLTESGSIKLLVRQ
jgi:uroporphyrinogen-III synthase